jgi:hypothetical protein
VGIKMTNIPSLFDNAQILVGNNFYPCTAHLFSLFNAWIVDVVLNMQLEKFGLMPSSKCSHLLLEFLSTRYNSSPFAQIINRSSRLILLNVAQFEELVGKMGLYTKVVEPLEVKPSPLFELVQFEHWAMLKNPSTSPTGQHIKHLQSASSISTTLSPPSTNLAYHHKSTTTMQPSR